jgi:hypothetical protein
MFVCHVKVKYNFFTKKEVKSTSYPKKNEWEAKQPAGHGGGRQQKLHHPSSCESGNSEHARLSTWVAVIARGGA